MLRTGVSIFLAALAVTTSASGGGTTASPPTFLYASERPLAGRTFIAIVGVLRQDDARITWQLDCFARIRAKRLATQVDAYGRVQTCSVGVPRGTAGRLLHLSYSAAGTGPEPGLKWERRGVQLSWTIRRR